MSNICCPQKVELLVRTPKETILLGVMTLSSHFFAYYFGNYLTILVLNLKPKGSSERKCAGNRSSNFCASKSSTWASSSWASIFGCQVFFLLFWLNVKTPIIRKQGLEEATFGNFYKTVVFFSFFLRDCFGSVQFCVGLLKSSVQGMPLEL